MEKIKITEQEKKEFLAAVGIMAEKHKDGATRAEIFRLLFPHYPSTTLRGTMRPEYNRLKYAAEELRKTGEIIFVKGARPDDPRVIERYLPIKPCPPDERLPMKPTHETCPPPPPAKPEQPPAKPHERPLTIEDVSRAVVLETEGQGNPISVHELQAKYFFQHPPDKVRQLLNYLVDIGQLNYAKDGITKRYYPSHVWPKPKPEPEPERQPERARKVLGFECEVCGALVGVRAQDGLFVLTCAGCSSEYLMKRGIAMRLHEPIEVLVWTPQRPGAEA